MKKEAFSIIFHSHIIYRVKIRLKNHKYRNNNGEKGEEEEKRGGGGEGGRKMERKHFPIMIHPHIIYS